MKKILLLLFVAFAVSANSNAQSLDAIFGRLVKKATEKAEKAEKTEKTENAENDGKVAEATKDNKGKSSNDDLLNLGKALLGEVVGGLTATDKITEKDIVGTWNYNGIACTLESEDMVAQIGAKIVTAKVEDKANEYLKKVGVENGTTTFEFAEGGKCVLRVGEKQFPGVYTLSEDGKNIVFSFLLGQVSLTSEVELGANGLVVDFDADKVLEILKRIGAAANDYAKNQQGQQGQSAQQSTANMVATLSALLEGYNGMRLGTRLTR